MTMNFPRTIYVTAFVVTLFFGNRTSSAAEPVVAPLANYVAPEIFGQEQLKRIRALLETCTLDSTRAGADFSYEFSFCHQDSDDVLEGETNATRAHLESCQGRNLAILWDCGEQQVNVCAASNCVVNFKKGKCALTDTSRWTFLTDAKHIHEFSDNEMLPKGVETMIRCDLAASQDGLVNGAGVTFDHEPLLRQTTFTKPNGNSLRYTLRTPNDQERFGSPLQEAQVHKPANNVTLSWTSFINQRDSALRWKIPTAAECARELELKIHSELTEEKFVPHGKREPEVLRTMLQQFTLTAPPQKQLEQDLKTIDDLIKFFDGVKARPEERPDEIAVEHARRLPGFCAACRRIGDLIDEELREKSAPISIDDPYLRFRAAEAILGPMRLEMIFMIGTITCADPRIPAHAKNDGLATVADFGCDSMYLYWFLQRVQAPDRDIASSMLLSRWGQPRIRNADTAMKNYWHDPAALRELESSVISLLIDLGRPEEIPRAKLVQHFQDQSKLSSTAQSKLLRRLSISPQGRKFLREMIQAQQADPAALARCGEVLRWRAAATLRTERFDFMSRAECDELVRLVQQPAAPDIR